MLKLLERVLEILPAGVRGAEKFAPRGKFLKGLPQFQQAQALLLLQDAADFHQSAPQDKASHDPAQDTQGQRHRAEGKGGQDQQQHAGCTHN